MATRAEINQWFETADVPTQAQFWATFASLVHVDDLRPISSIQDLAQILAAKAEKQQFDQHLTDENAHSELFEKVYNPFKHITYTPAEDAAEITLPELVDAELDAVMYRGQVVDADEITLDIATGALSNWDFKAGVKYIIFYTKI
ncbi:hypothetical protein [Flavobacterium cerinum]|uniref:Uncharacterized protein n=1 Tax=Flavobacterium cerinum TaxID=2502784 RepID=A0A3S4T3F4_9FLAO|nr:hypothetical protein [Flavobacterium cerinum]RWX03351.1 hypothetical protein EPI11_00030 [Flavobacterium cerinum]